MVVIENKDLIVKYELLSAEEKNDLMLFFEKNDNKGIVELEEHKYCTYAQMSKELEPMDIRVSYTPDMFMYGQKFIFDFDYAIAIDDKENAVCVLRWEFSSYIHSYAYSGGADMWLLDRYECIILHECNEFSVELCQGALKLWKGKYLILVGKEWKGLVSQLPDLDGVECFCLEKVTKVVEAMGPSTNALHIVAGIPHEEKMERYESGIMYYDEVMSFTYMFSECRQLGNKNPDKNFFVLDAGYGNLGLFAIFGKSEIVARYAKSRGFIPVIQMKRDEGSFYQNMPGDDAWQKFFNQPEEYSIEEVMESQNVFWSPIFYNGSVQSSLMGRMAGNTRLSWSKGIYNDAVCSYIAERQKRFLPYPEKTLGVLIRGTDYVSTNLHNHAKHATKEMIADKIDEVWNQWEGFEYIYIATEDESYCEYFKSRYSDKVYFTDQQRFTTGKGEMLAEMHRKDENKRDGFLLGVEYILSIYLLSKCSSLIASGACAGVNEALKENKGMYKHFYMFELGVN